MSSAETVDPLELTISGDHRALGRQRRPSDVEGEYRIRRGVFVDKGQWDRADSWTRHLARIEAVSATRMTRIVFSHESAAVLLGIPLLERPPEAVHATTSPRSRRRSRAGVVWHHHDLDKSDVSTVGALETTSISRTVIDLARTLSFAEAVTSLDAVLDDESGSHAPRWDAAASRIQRSELRQALDRLSSHPGSRRAAVALDFADHRSGSVGESLSRSQIHAHRFPAPDLQVPVVGGSGRRYLADFAWYGGALLGEFDGRVKYSRGRIRGAASADEIVWAEKQREDDLRAAGHDIARWTWSDARDGEALSRILTSHGLPSSGRQPRPVFRKGNS